MSLKFTRTNLDASKLDCLKNGEACLSETKVDPINHEWAVFKYQDVYTFFIKDYLTSPEGPVLGYELDHENLNLLFEHKPFKPRALIKPITESY